MSFETATVLCLLLFYSGWSQSQNVQASSDLTTLVHNLQNQIDVLQKLVIQGFSGTCKANPRDCQDLQRSGKNVSKVYTIYPTVDEHFQVYCDMDTDGGGWTVIQRRINGSENFFRSFNDYEVGFGNKSGEHWLGNDHIHTLTNRCTYELKVVLKDFQGDTKVADYDSFSVGDKASKYTLHVSGYSGNAGDSLAFDHDGHAFSTADVDNDDGNTVNCAQKHHGGWWYSNCFKSNLNGVYGKADETGIIWGSFRNWQMYVLKETKMMVRPINCD